MPGCLLGSLQLPSSPFNSAVPAARAAVGRDAGVSPVDEDNLMESAAALSWPGTGIRPDDGFRGGAVTGRPPTVTLPGPAAAASPSCVAGLPTLSPCTCSTGQPPTAVGPASGPFVPANQGPAVAMASAPAPDAVPTERSSPPSSPPPSPSTPSSALSGTLGSRGVTLQRRGDVPCAAALPSAAGGAGCTCKPPSCGCSSCCCSGSAGTLAATT